MKHKSISFIDFISEKLGRVTHSGLWHHIRIGMLLALKSGGLSFETQPNSEAHGDIQVKTH